MRFGELLRKERERQAMTLDGISASTCISVRYLQALEADRFADLPGGVFSRGIVRSYARSCGLNEDEILQRFITAAQNAGTPVEAVGVDLAEFAENVKRSRSSDRVQQSLRWAGVAGMVLAVLALAVLTAVVLHRRGMFSLPQRSSQATRASRVSPVTASMPVSPRTHAARRCG